MILVVLASGAGVGLIVLDGMARRTAETYLGNRAKDELGLDRTPAVRIGGRSFLWQAVRGRFGLVSMRAASLSEEGTTLDDIDVQLRDVTVPRGVLTGAGGTVRISDGSAHAVLPWTELARRVSSATGTHLQLRPAGQDVRATTRFRILGRSVDVALTMSIGLERSRVVMRPLAASLDGHKVSVDTLRPALRAIGQEKLLAAVPLPLTGLPDGVRVMGLQVTDDGVMVDARLASTVVTVPPRSS